MGKLAVFQQYLRSRGIFEMNWFPWHRIPVVSKEVLGGRWALVFFRYISWFLTSLFYLMGSPESPMIFKLGVITALLLASRVALQLYEKSKENSINVLGLIFVDTLFIIVLLIPTGGFDSPFIWYALNPVFMAISLLPIVYCWGLLGILVAVVVGSTFYHGNTVRFLQVWRENPWFSLLFLLLTTAALLFARLAKQLSEAYEKLTVAHQSTERLLEHISNLYHAMESFSVGEDPRRLADLLATYSRRLTGSRSGFCYLSQDQYQSLWETSDPDVLLSGLRNRHVDALWRKVKDGQAEVYRMPLMHNVLEGIEIVCFPLQSSSTCFGMLGYTVYARQKSHVNEDRAIKYLAELVAIFLEQRKVDDLASRLMVVEEQNRIANEIHDGVSQHLFSIVYALHALSQKKANLQDDEVQKQLNLVKRTANQTARDLRASIYRISPSKRGEQVFISGVSAYLEDLAELNGIVVEFNPEGSEEALSPALRKAFYRIIREATSNATRHGKCGKIKIDLKMTPGKTILNIVDDGNGFNVTEQTQNGLGLVNMRSLMTSFKGRFTLESLPGKGTVVTCAVPEYD